ncbi:MAG: DUF5989 family protein [Bacteriovoracales bacterium]|nr:DUF5989 family protein [Bacteriovoracales bacterium]
MGLLKEYWEFLKERKKFVLIPVFLFVALMGLLFAFSTGSTVTPFIYTLF